MLAPVDIHSRKRTLRCRWTIRPLLKSVVIPAIPHHFPQTHFLSHLILTTNQPTMSSSHTANATSSCVPGHMVNAAGNGQAAVTVDGGVNITVSTDPL